MPIQRTNHKTFDFDGKFIDDDDDDARIECSVTPPVVGGDIAKIDIRIPNTNESFPHLLNPFDIKSENCATKISLHNVWFREYELSGSPRRKTGSKSIKLSHIGELKIIHTKKTWEQLNADATSDVISIRAHLTENKYFQLPDDITFPADSPLDWTIPFYNIEVPVLGQVQIVREWVVSRFKNGTGEIHSALCAIVEFKGAKKVDTATSYLILNQLLEVISLFSRQRVAVLGWDVEFGNRSEQIWKDPLEPLSTKNFASGRRKYLVIKDFERLVSDSIKNYVTLNAEKKQLCVDLLIGLTPYIDLNPPQRFLSMFQALESCRRFATSQKTEIMSVEDNELVAALDQAKDYVSTSVADRIDGFIFRVKNTGGSLKNDLKDVLRIWEIKTDDLWPLSGTQKLFGLIQVRDRLVHRGALSLSFQGIADATQHLSIIVERIILGLLNIPIEETSAGVKSLKSEHWYDSDYVLEQRCSVTVPD
jgi:hypothetical protein